MLATMIRRLLALSFCPFLVSAEDAATPPPGAKALFNGKDLSGWEGWNPHESAKFAKDPAKLEENRAKQRAEFATNWRVENGELVNDGHGPYASTLQDYGDMELWIDYKTVAKADSGIYLRGTPQVQIWDHHQTVVPEKPDRRPDLGSGGLFNNTPKTPGRDPLVLADKAFGEWNHFHILQVGARTTVHLNGKLVVDHALMENYWDRALPLPAKGPIQLQTHGGEIRWKNLQAREIPGDEANAILEKKGDEGYRQIMNGKDLTGWAGPVDNYEVRSDGAVVCKPGKGGTIYFNEELSDFQARVEFQLPPGGNNGLAIRYPGQGDTAYVGMCELQVLDTEHTKYAKLDPRQAHGSAYGMAAATRGYLRPTGEWNFQEVTIKGSTIRVELNGSVILDTDLAKVTETMANKEHPGKDRTSGFFGFAGHNEPVAFRKVMIKKL